MDSLDAVLEALTSDSQTLFAELEREELGPLLDARDGGAFEMEWLTHSAEVAARLSNLTEDERRKADRLRKAAYRAAFAFSADPDFASYVSDDFELIGRAAAVLPDERWINELWKTYRCGGFPTGPTYPDRELPKSVPPRRVDHSGR